MSASIVFATTHMYVEKNIEVDVAEMLMEK
jgi:hypothetical protein